jgi:AcrR family transcriptional regulator
MESYNEFLQKATDLFIENGAKTLTMDDVAKEFGISKKTLYQKYRNKEALLEDVLAFKLDGIIHKMQQQDLEADNAVERMFCRDRQIEGAVNSNKTNLIKQLVKYYPAIFTKHMVNFSEKFSEVLVSNIERGRAQGFYRDDFDASIYAKLFFQLMMSYENSPFIDSETIGRDKFRHEVMMMYMNAITTEKGKEIMKRINENNQ